MTSPRYASTDTMRLPSARTVAETVGTGDPAGEANGPFCTFDGADTGGVLIAVVMTWLPGQLRRSGARPLPQHRRRRLLQQLNLPRLQPLQSLADADRATPQQRREKHARSQVRPGGGGVGAGLLVQDGPIVPGNELLPP